MLLIKAAKFMIFIYILFIISSVELILSEYFGKLQSSLLTIKPKIGNREKHQRKHGKYPKKLGKQ